MFKKIFILFICVCLCVIAGCSENKEPLSIEKGEEPVVSEVVKPQTAVNPLTGVDGMSLEKAAQRPVAIMINNLSRAQSVQTGVARADVVYETEVEDGITRLMAVYQDVSALEKIGSVRSARYPYIDLAMGHNAIYVHHGQDPTYAKPHLRDADAFTVDKGRGGARIANGLASEHTLYAYGDDLWDAIKTDGITTENTNSNTWLNFADEETVVALPSTAQSVTVKFSSSYKTTFKYDAAIGKYTRYSNGTEYKDYVTSEPALFKNVFVITTTINDYPDGYHRRVYLESGDGYYFTNGTYTPIKWSKGAASNSLKFTNADGTPLTVSAGNTWVCIANMSTSQPIIE